MGINGITDEALSSIHEINLHESEHSYAKESVCDIAFDWDHAEMLRDFVEESYERLKSINNRRQGLVQLATVSGANIILLFMTKWLYHGRLNPHINTVDTVRSNFGQM